MPENKNPEPAEDVDVVAHGADEAVPGCILNDSEAL